MREPTTAGFPELQTFVVRLGAAMNAVGEPAYSVQDRLGRVARGYGARSARISAFPTYMMVSMGAGEPAATGLGPCDRKGRRRSFRGTRHEALVETQSKESRRQVTHACWHA